MRGESGVGVGRGEKWRMKNERHRKERKDWINSLRWCIGTHGIVFFWSLQRAKQRRCDCWSEFTSLRQPTLLWHITLQHVVPGLSIFLCHPSSFTSQALCLSPSRILANNAGTKLRINIKHLAFDFGTGYKLPITDFHRRLRLRWQFPWLKTEYDAISK